MSQVPALAAAGAAQTGTAAKPNIIVIISDQFRGDCIGAMGLKSDGADAEPGSDGCRRSAVSFGVLQSTGLRTGSREHVHRPVSEQTRRLAQWAGLARGRGHVGCDSASGRILDELHRQVAPDARRGIDARAEARLGPPQSRGGFSDLWEAANELEFTSHAYEGALYDNDGKAINFSNQYRTDFMTDRAKRFLRSAKGPFFITLSYLEVHHQNDSDTFDPPKEFAHRYPNPFIPPDLRPLPGSWPSQLSDYFGVCCEDG